MMNDEKFWQSRRLLYLFRKLQNGRSYSAKELKEEYIQEGLGDYSLRTVQNDLQLMSEIEPMIFYKKDGRENRWYFDRQIYRTPAINMSSQLLSLYLLKAQLKAFSGTFIQREIDKLISHLEEKYPSDVFMQETLFWDRSIGNYNYANHDEQIQIIIDAIVEKKWIEISYDTAQEGKLNVFVCRITKMFAHGGYLYTAAYVPKYKEYIALSVHRIQSMDFIDYDSEPIPEFDYDEFSALRFGVFWGTPERVVIRLSSYIEKFFENRFWHQTQNFVRDSNGTLLLEITVPLAPELISWITSWGSEVEVLTPDTLRESIMARLSKTLDVYTKK